MPKHKPDSRSRQQDQLDFKQFHQFIEYDFYKFPLRKLLYKINNSLHTISLLIGFWLIIFLSEPQLWLLLHHTLTFIKLLVGFIKAIILIM